MTLRPMGMLALWTSLWLAAISVDDVAAQNNFLRNDSYDFRSYHLLKFFGNGPNDFSIAMKSKADFRSITLTIETGYE